MAYTHLNSCSPLPQPGLLGGLTVEGDNRCVKAELVKREQALQGGWTTGRCGEGAGQRNIHDGKLRWLVGLTTREESQTCFRINGPAYLRRGGVCFWLHDLTVI